jgi:glutaredoxin 3
MIKKFLFLSLAIAGHLAAADLTLYYSPYCPYSREVLSYLDSIQKKIPMKNVKQDALAKEELKNRGGALEVPCLMIGEQAIYSSEAIIEWLKEHEGEL